MKVSASIELIWQLACREAIAAEFKEIEPEHFLMALLKFAETPQTELEQLGAGGEAVHALIGDMNALKEELGIRRISPGALRRELRTTMGRGGHPYEGGQVHRASGSRNYFDKAASLAADVGSEVLMGRHLFLSMLDSPTPALAQVLAGVRQNKEEAPQPLVSLYEHGKDLNRLVAEQNLGKDGERIAEAKAVLGVLGQQQRNSVFLVSDDSETARKVVFTAAHLLGSKDVPPALRKKRIIDLSEATGTSSKSKTATTTVEGLLLKAAGIREIILFLPAVGSKTQKLFAWNELLKNLAGAGKVQFLARLPLSLRDLVEKNSAWRKAARTITVAEVKAGEIPKEL